jgi:Protein of unknown function (DUF3187)
LHGSGEIRRRAGQGLALTTCLALSCVAGPAVATENWFPVRTHNPFLQIYGLPLFQGAEVAPRGRSAWQLTFDIANHADASGRGGESVTLDGESYYLTLAWRRGITDWLEVGVDVPLTAHEEGVLDNVIEGWHDLFGMTNSKREGPSNQLHFHYEHPDVPAFDLQQGVSGLGDIRVHAAMPLHWSALGVDDALALRAGIKLPTGDADKLLGSGAVDTYVALYYSGAHAFGLDRLGLSAHVGVLRTGDSDLFAPIQENTVPFGGFAANWRFTERLRAKAAMYAQGDYVDSALDELGSSIQLIVGGDYRFASHGLSLSFGIVEELFSDATADFAIELSLRHELGSGPGT